MTEWVRMSHSGTGGSTLVPKRSVQNYESRGWVEENEAPEPAPSEPAADVRPKPIKSKNEKVTQDPAPDSNESKEDG